MPDMHQTLARYADLIVKIGINLQPGQKLAMTAPIQTAELARLIAASAYEAGARLVDVMWGDEQISLIRFQKAPRDSFEEFPVWRAKAMEEYVNQGEAFFQIYAEDPELLKDQDPELINTVQKTSLKHTRKVVEAIVRNATNWSLASLPVPAWSAKVFPGLPAADAESSLWEAIAEVCRLNLPDPVEAWREHLAGLAKRCEVMNAKAFRALKFSGPGTQLTVGLAPGHIWTGGQSTSEKGITFTPNLPTEEIFTVPDRNYIDGTVKASLPLSYMSNLIDDFSLTFKDGKVVDYHAGSGQAILKVILDTDEGARSLGEVALVPYSSPISKLGLMFFNTLFDENAASHLALGEAYKFTMQGGEAMTDEEFAARGGNLSLTHVDFMIGSGEMDVDGVSDSGATEPVMRQGEWVF